MDICIAFLVGVLVGQWIILWGFWRAALRIIEKLNDFQSSNEHVSSRSKTIIIPNDDFLYLDTEEEQ